MQKTNFTGDVAIAVPAFLIGDAAKARDECYRAPKT